MPVIGTPFEQTPTRLIATPVRNPQVPCCDSFPPVAERPSLLACRNMNVLAVEPTQKFKQPLFGRIRTLRVQAGQQAVLKWTLQNSLGNAIDLRDCVCESSTESSLSSEGGSETIVTINDCALTVKFRLHEQVSLGVCRPPAAEFPVTATSAQDGELQITLPRESTLYPGIYFGEVAVLGLGDDGQEYIFFSNTFYVAIERGNWAGTRPGRAGPPSFAEVRLHLRDSNPAENVLLADLMFDDSEIAMAIARPIEYWNEIPPPVRTYTTQTFPHRYHWLEAIAGELFLMAAESYRRNHLAYSAAGLAIDDQNKEINYEQASLRRLTTWREFVKRKKAEINLEAAYGTVASAYGSRISF